MTNECEYTAGPWRVDDHAEHGPVIAAGDGDLVALMLGTKGPEDPANARLIASAPSLHRMNRLLMELYHELDGCTWRREDGGENKLAVAMANVASALTTESARHPQG